MAGDIKVGLVQINNSFSGQNYLPYSVGILQAYAEKKLRDPEHYEFLLPIYLREAPEKAVEKLLDADQVFFSTYVWNIRISLEIARRLKAIKPEIVIIMGGPQIPDQGHGFIASHPFIDLLCHGEGEQGFVDVLEVDLERAQRRDWGELASTTYLKPDGEIVSYPKRERLKELEELSSPYLEGTFDKLMAANPQERWIALWETNRGCPFSCTFCDWGSAIASKVFRFDIERLYKELDWFAENKIEYIFCADANFGILPRDLDIVNYAAEVKAKTGYPHALSVQNTKNATERAYAVQKALSDAGLNKGVTLSLQSIDATTLKEIKRSNISSDTYQELQRRFTRDGVETYTDFILGLPGETYDSFLNGVSEVVANGQHNRIQFNNLSILPNAEMGDLEYQKQHGMEIVETEVVNIHGSLEISDNEILERQELVIGTHTCPREDWAKTRAASWACSFFYFNKVLQIPLLLLHEHFSIPFKDLISIFSEALPEEFPTLGKIQSFFWEKAKDIQNGGAEYCPSEDFLNIWWPADELVLIELVYNDHIDEFYEEAELALIAYLERNNYMVPEQVVRDAVALNRELLKKPFQIKDGLIPTQFNVWEVYEAAKVGQCLPLMEGDYIYSVDKTAETWSSWEDWCREVIWWGNKKGAYLYGNIVSDPQLSGHF